jgi:dienelactone hydrolase
MKRHVLIFALLCLTVAQAQTNIDRHAEISQAIFLDHPPLAPRTFSSETITPAVRIERVTYATQYAMRVPAIVYVPTHVAGKAPALLVVAGHGGDKTSWYEVYTGLLYASAGAVVLTYDPAGEGERNPQRASDSRLHDAPTGLEHPERVGGLMIEDVMQGMRYLASREDVDASRIGVLGYSMGTLHAAVAAAMEGPRALLLSAGGNLDGPGQYWDSGNKLNCQVATYKALSHLGDRGAALYALIAQRGSTFLMNGAKDSLITTFNEQEPWFEGLRQRIYAEQPAYKENLPETFFDPDAGHRPAFAERLAALWLNRQLHFPNWTDAQINAFPLTAAHEWASAHGVRMAAQYDNSIQEGGVPILDLHLPGLTRQQLEAVPRAEWEANKANYTFDSWIKRAQADEARPAGAKK